ncbi:MAG: hypothetical protein EBT20_19335, partial [Alphaproteobacteria bacterium]|nr:hypothetical protein [Alphaproteobacteria bacterium]
PEPVPFAGRMYAILGRHEGIDNGTANQREHGGKNSNSRPEQTCKGFDWSVIWSAFWSVLRCGTMSAI